MKRITITYVLAVLFAFCSCSHSKYSPDIIDCHISGTVENMEGNLFVLVTPIDASYHDTLLEMEVKDGKFSGSFEGDSQLVYEITVLNEYGIGKFAYFFADNNVSIICDGNDKYSPVSIKPQGKFNKPLATFINTANDLLRDRENDINNIDERKAELRRNGKDYTDEAEAIMSEQNAEGTSHERMKELTDSLHVLISKQAVYTPEYYALEKEYLPIYHEKELFEFDHIRNNVDLVSFFFLYNKLKREWNDYTGRNYYNNSTQERTEMSLANISILQDIYANYYYDKFEGHPFHEKIGHLSATPQFASGVKFKDFSLPDKDGNIQTLSSLIEGKVAILDFWASWCLNCRETSVSMIPLWEKYHDMGLVVVGAAREYKNDSAWKDALQTMGCPWTQLLALEPNHNIWELYGIAGGAGGVFLIDKEGTIISVNPSLDEIERVLKMNYE